MAGASRPAAGITATVLGVGALLVAAIGVVVQLKDALNVVWEVEEPKKSGLWHFARNYVLSFAAVLTLGFLLLVSLVVSAGLAAAGKYIDTYLPKATACRQHADFVRRRDGALLDDVQMATRCLHRLAGRLAGRVPHGVVFRSGEGGDRLLHRKAGIEVNLRGGGFDHRYLIWVYYISQIILMGAEVTHSYAEHNGSFQLRKSAGRSASSDHR